MNHGRVEVRCPVPQCQEPVPSELLQQLLQDAGGGDGETPQMSFRLSNEWFCSSQVEQEIIHYSTPIFRWFFFFSAFLWLPSPPAKEGPGRNLFRFASQCLVLHFFKMFL